MKKVLVIGDVIIDHYRYGKALGISAETPTIVSEFVREEETLGGAALVARHLNYLGCKTELLSIGDYINANMLENGLQHNIINLDGWITTKKERIFVDGYKLAQVDFINKGSHNGESRAEMKSRIRELIPEVDVVVVADNRHGVFDEKMAKLIIRECERYGVLLCVDSQVSQNYSNHHWYRNADLFFLNRKEVMTIAEDHRKDIEASVLEKLDGNLVIKLGHGGAYAVLKDGKCHFGSLPDEDLTIVDTCGAGDAFMAKFVSIFNRKNWEESLSEAVKYATNTCTYYGTKTPDEVRL